jgi:hypothetical protein
MKKKFNFLVLSIFFLSFIQPVSIPVITFEQLRDYSGTQPIQIRGFLYPTSFQTIVLAPQPDLKSCCIGNFLSDQQQITLKGIQDISHSQATLVQGILKIEPQYKEGRLIQYYVLDQAKVISGKKFPFWTAVSCVLLTLIMLLFVKFGITLD